MPATISCLINGVAHSPAAQRARDLVARLPSTVFTVELLPSAATRGASFLAFVTALQASKPAITYVMDNSLAGVLAATWHRLRHRNRVVIDTGDEIVALVRSSGLRGPAGLVLTWLLERLSFRIADLFIVRGTQHKTLFAARGIAAEVIPDGVRPEQVIPQRAAERRVQLGLQHRFTVGLVGSCVWSRKLQMCYGWELIGALDQLRDLTVTGVLVGDGDGIPHLKAECARLGLEDRMLFLGRIPYAQLADTLGVMDVCLSTQTNDVVGQVRTTGKLPLYLAAGRFVLASDVGEAQRVLPPAMLVPYVGTRDPYYPTRLAERIRTLVADPGPISLAQQQSPLIAQAEFSYEVLVPRLAAALRGL